MDTQYGKKKSVIKPNLQRLKPGGRDPDPKFQVGDRVQGNLLRESIEEAGGYSQGKCVCTVAQIVQEKGVRGYYYELKDCRWLEFEEDGWDSTDSFAPEEFLTLYEGDLTLV